MTGSYMPLIDAYIQQMKDKDIMEPRAGRQWISNIVFVREKEGSLHYCIDYRGLNDVTQKTNYWYPLPCIDTCHDSLGRKTFFSSLHMHIVGTVSMHSRYCQVPMHEENVDKTLLRDEKGHLL